MGTHALNGKTENTVKEAQAAQVRKFHPNKYPHADRNKIHSAILNYLWFWNIFERTNTYKVSKCQNSSTENHPIDKKRLPDFLANNFSQFMGVEQSTLK